MSQEVVLGMVGGAMRLMRGGEEVKEGVTLFPFTMFVGVAMDVGSEV